MEYQAGHCQELSYRRL